MGGGGVCAHGWPGNCRSPPSGTSGAPLPLPSRQASLGEKVAWKAPFSMVNGHHVPTTLCTYIPSCLYLIPETLSETSKWRKEKLKAFCMDKPYTVLETGKPHQ